jgi:23S rRNA pseudouridine1911/1915/1917 synthase
LADRVFSVNPEDSGERLDHYLAGAAGLTRNQAQRLIQQDCVKVQGAKVPKNYRLRGGEQIEVVLPEPEAAEPKAQDIPVEILYQDQYLAVISKPAGLVVHPAPGHPEGTLVNALLYSMHDLPGVGGVMRPGIVHRLDRDTSGLMVIAKNDEAMARLQEMVKSRELKRIYLALVHGVPATRFGTIDAPIGRDARNRKKMAVRGEHSRQAITRFEVVRQYEGASLLQVELVTGRTHQIRVHLAYIQHPVVGDPEYGTSGGLEKRLGLQRQFLHAFRISFRHPFSGLEMTFDDELPPDLQAALDKLEKTEAPS